MVTTVILTTLAANELKRAAALLGAPERDYLSMTHQSGALAVSSKPTGLG